MQQSPCDAFRKNPNGSWTSIKSVTISKPGGGAIKISPRMTFDKGVFYRGVDLAKWLDENCP